MKPIVSTLAICRRTLHTQPPLLVIISENSPRHPLHLHLHHFPKSGARNMTTDIRPSFSKGEDVTALHDALHPLLRANGGKWQITAANNGLERSFKFKTFKKSWEFMNAVAAECAAKRHHPEWSNVYNTTFIRWTTHSPPGLSSKDVSMAKFCDEQADTFGELEVEQSTENGRDLADRVAVEGGDCCIPKRKSSQAK